MKKTKCFRIICCKATWFFDEKTNFSWAELSHQESTDLVFAL